LLDFHHSPHRKTTDGKKGAGDFCNGAEGKELILSVPNGPDVKDVSGINFYQACSDLHDQLSNNRFVHSGQELLIQHFLGTALIGMTIRELRTSEWRMLTTSG
jgi:GTPase involved in cell partitioning and DNA repair